MPVFRSDRERAGDQLDFAALAESAATAGELHPVRKEEVLQRGASFDPEMSSEWEQFDAHMVQAHCGNDKSRAVRLRGKTKRQIGMLQGGPRDS
jgi:hypothetical protein